MGEVGDVHTVRILQEAWCSSQSFTTSNCRSSLDSLVAASVAGATLIPESLSSDWCLLAPPPSGLAPGLVLNLPREQLLEFL